MLRIRITDPACHFEEDPDPSFQIKAQNLEKVLKLARLPCILAYHQQNDSDPDPAYPFDADPDLANKFDVDPDPDPTYQFDENPCGSGSGLATLASTTLGKETELRVKDPRMWTANKHRYTVRYKPDPFTFTV